MIENKKGESKYDAAVAAGQKNKERDYWLNKLSGEWVKSHFPYDYNHNHNDTRNTRRHRFGFSSEIHTRLMKLRNDSDNRLHMTLTALLTVLLAKYTGCGDIILGSPVLRQNVKLNFINTILPLRNRCHDNMTFKELLLQVRQTVFDAYEHQNYPMEVLLNQLNLSPAGNGFPLFDVAILVENIHDKEYILPTSPAFVFSFSRAKDNSAVDGVVEYDARLYEKITVERIVSHFKQLMRVVLFNVDVQLAHIDMIPGEEKKRILFDFNKEPEPLETGQTVYELFQEQVEKYPDNTAVVFENNKLTYEELNTMVNRLARLLRKRGVGPNRIAALLFNWSPGMIVAMLAALKAGAAYLAIDPDYPEDRVFAILEDSRAAVVLTTSAIVERFFFTSLQGLHKVKIAPHRTVPRPAVTDLDALPIPRRSMVDYEKYSRYIGPAGVKNTYITLLTSRTAGPGLENFFTRSAENIFAEIQLFYSMGVRRFVFIDDTFILDIKNSSRLFRLIIENNMDLHLFFPNGLRGDILTPDYIDMMVEAGTVNIAFSLETASPRLQKLLGKNLDIGKVRENLEYICEKYPQVILELFITHGFPTETEEEALMTMDFLKGLKWVDMPYFNILRIYPDTEVEKLALENGTSRDEICKSEKLAPGELPDYLPFDKSFTLKCQSDLLDEYFLSRERLLHVLPYQMKVFTEEEIIRKYDSYLPAHIDSFTELLTFTGIAPEELKAGDFLDKERVSVLNLDNKIEKSFPRKAPHKDALKVLLLDMSQLFSKVGEEYYDFFEPPLGLMLLMTLLNRQFGTEVNGKIAKSRVDFDSYRELKQLVTTFDPDIIGIRTLSIYKGFFHRTAALIRDWGIDCPIITGGPYASSSVETVLQDRNVDLVVLGEGEITFSDLIGKMIENKGKLPDEEILKQVPGIAFIPEDRKQQNLFAREILQLDALEAEGILAEQSAENLVKVNQSTDPAYVIYTSGSTGTPKGILVEHRCFTDFTRWAVEEFEHRPGYQVLLSNSYASDGSIQQIFPPLVTGGTLHLVRTELRLDTPAYVKYLKENKINNIDEVPVVMNLVFESVVLDETKELLPDLTCLSLGSEYVPIEVARKSRKYLNHEGRIINAYGPAETSVETCTYHFDGRSEQERSLIGKPRRNLNVYILDQMGNLCPIGVPGEICIGGFGVARGYLNRPELTAEKFLSDSYRSYRAYSSKKIYKTGDQGRWQADGNIEFLGRIDNQVNIRGYRVELGEIENQLLSHDAIVEAVVLIKEKEREKYLCTYFTSNQAVDVADLREYLCQKLPEYMVPLYFINVDTIPLNPNGKVDRKALPAPEMSSVSNYIAPANETEERLTEIWCDVLGVDKEVTGVHADFFELGGHSLKTIKLIARIHQTFDVKVPVKEVFNLKTIRRLSQYILGAKKEEYLSISPAEQKEYYVLSSAQKRMYVVQQLEPDKTSYNMTEIKPLNIDIDTERLEDTFKKLVARHENLRTCFKMVAGEPVQKIDNDVEFAIEYREVGSREEVEEMVTNLIRPFDLSRVPLLRVVLINIPGVGHLLMVDIHHIICDGVSYEILVRDFTAIRAEEELPGLRLHYKDYTEWQKGLKEKETGRLKRQEEFWLKQFNDDEIPILNMPVDYPRPPVKSFKGSKVIFGVDRYFTGQLKRLASETGTTLFMLLLTAYNILFSRYTRQEDIIIGSPISGRNHKDLQNIIGMFVNILPLRNRPVANKCFKEFLAEVRENTLNAFENQDYQFEELVHKLGVKRDPARQSLFDAAFQIGNVDIGSTDEREVLTAGDDNRDNKHPSPDDSPIFAMFHEKYSFITIKYDLAMTVEEIGGGRLRGALVYATDLFGRSTVEKIVKRFFDILKQVVENRDIKLEEIEISHELAAVKSYADNEDFLSDFEF